MGEGEVTVEEGVVRVEVEGEGIPLLVESISICFSEGGTRSNIDMDQSRSGRRERRRRSWRSRRRRR